MEASRLLGEEGTWPARLGVREVAPSGSEIAVPATGGSMETGGAVYGPEHSLPKFVPAVLSALCCAEVCPPPNGLTAGTGRHETAREQSSLPKSPPTCEVITRRCRTPQPLTQTAAFNCAEGIARIRRTKGERQVTGNKTHEPQAPSPAQPCRFPRRG